MKTFNLCDTRDIISGKKNILDFFTKDKLILIHKDLTSLADNFTKQYFQISELTDNEFKRFIYCIENIASNEQTSYKNKILRLLDKYDRLVYCLYCNCYRDYVVIKYEDLEITEISNDYLIKCTYLHMNRDSTGTELRKDKKVPVKELKTAHFIGGFTESEYMAFLDLMTKNYY